MKVVLQDLLDHVVRPLRGVPHERGDLQDLLPRVPCHSGSRVVLPYQPLRVRTGQPVQVQVRRQFERQPLDRHHRLVQEVEVPRKLELVLDRQVDDALGVLRERDLPEAAAENRLDHLFEIPLKFTAKHVKIRLRRDDPHLYVRLHQAAEVLPDEGNEGVGEKALLVLGDAAHDPEVHDADPPVRKDEEIPGVRIGVEKTVLEHHLVGDLDPLPGDVREIEPRFLETPHVVDPDPGDPLQNEHSQRRKLPKDGRDVRVRALVKMEPEPGGVLPFQDEVHLLPDAPRELVHDHREIEDPHLGDPPVDQLRDPAKDLHVLADERLDVGTPDLEDHVLARQEPRPVDLGDRGGGNRDIVEAREDLIDRPLPLGFENGPRLLDRKGRNLILELAELLDERAGNEVGPNGEDLPELDERGAQLLEREPDPLGEGGPFLGEGTVRSFPPSHPEEPDPPPERNEPPQVQALEELPEPVLEKNVDDVPETPDVPVRMADPKEIERRHRTADARQPSPPSIFWTRVESVSSRF